MHVFSSQTRPAGWSYPEVFNREFKSVSPVSSANQNRGGSFNQYKAYCSNPGPRVLTPNYDFNTGPTLPTNRQPTPCLNCAKLENDLSRMKKALLQFSKKQNSVEQHLKQYESLLKIKENMLNAKESTLNEQMTFVQDGKNSISTKKAFKTDPTHSETSGFNKTLREASKNLLKNSTRSQSEDFQDKNFQILDLIQKKEKILEGKEQEIERKFLKFVEIKQMLEIKEEELKIQMKEICFEKEEVLKKEKLIAEENLKIRIQKNRLKSKSENMKNIKEQSLKLKYLYENLLGADYSKVLSESRLSTDVQKSGLDRLSESNLDGILFRKIVLKETEKSLPGSPGSAFNKMLIELNTESQTEAAWVSGNNPNLTEITKKREPKTEDLYNTHQIEEMQKEIEKLRSTLTGLSDENTKLKDTIQKMTKKIEKIKKKKEKLKQEKGFDQLDEIIEQLEDKLKIVTLKEAEIIEVNKKIAAEKEMILNEAECLKILYSDHNRDKAELQEEKERLFYQKNAIFDLERINSERSKLMEIKEKEIVKLKNEVLLKEIRLKKIYTGIPRTSNRVSTQKIIVSDSSYNM